MELQSSSGQWCDVYIEKGVVVYCTTGSTSQLARQTGRQSTGSHSDGSPAHYGCISFTITILSLTHLLTSAAITSHHITAQLQPAGGLSNQSSAAGHLPVDAWIDERKDGQHHISGHRWGRRGEGGKGGKGERGLHVYIHIRLLLLHRWWVRQRQLHLHDS